MIETRWKGMRDERNRRAGRGESERERRERNEGI